MTLEIDWTKAKVFHRYIKFRRIVTAKRESVALLSDQMKTIVYNHLDAMVKEYPDFPEAFEKGLLPKAFAKII